MKNAVFLLLSVCLLFFLACQKEQMQQNIAPQKEQGSAPLLRTDAPPPDLIISEYTTDIGPMTDICFTDTLLPNTHCNGGVRNFVATISVKNIGASPLPSGTLEVEWFDFGIGFNNSFVMSVPHNGIPVQDSIFISRSYYVGPCDCTGVIRERNCFIHRYTAVADPNNQVIEVDDFNNTSEVYTTCDGCGDCVLVQPTDEGPLPVEL